MRAAVVLGASERRKDFEMDSFDKLKDDDRERLVEQIIERRESLISGFENLQALASVLAKEIRVCEVLANKMKPDTFVESQEVMCECCRDQLLDRSKN